MSHEDGYNTVKRSVKERVNRGLAFVGIAAVSGGVSANIASAKNSAPAKPNTPGAARLLSGAEMDPFDKRFLKLVGGAINEINHDKSKNVFYGAILIPATISKHAAETCVHIEPDKDLVSRGDDVRKSPLVLVNPVIKEINGRLYAIGFDRGTVLDRNDAANGTRPSYDFEADITNTTDIPTLQHNRFVDLGQAYKLNHGRLGFYSEGGYKPTMVKSRVMGTNRGIDDPSHPAYAEVEGLWYDFQPSTSLPDTDGTYLEDYMQKTHFTKLGANYKPPFYAEMVKESRQNT